MQLRGQIEMNRTERVVMTLVQGDIKRKDDEDRQGWRDRRQPREGECDTKNKTWTQKTPGRLKPREGKHKDTNRNSIESSIENSIETCPMSCSVEPLK